MYCACSTSRLQQQLAPGDRAKLGEYLDSIRDVERRLQIGSSSPRLVAVTPAGVRVIKRGNPFDGGIGRIDELLNTVARTG